MTSWQTKTIGELVDYEQPSKYLVKDTNYIEDGTPVLTANKAFILGYTHEAEGIYIASKDSPVIIFDDFTTDNKFVDFDFKVKSSAIKILTAKPSNVLPRFVHGAMQLIKTEITEHKRRFISEYQFHPIDTPDLPEQERIVGVLEVWDEYIEKLEQKIALKEQLKKGLMQQLLTGNRRLPGFNSEWKEVRIGELGDIYTGNTPPMSVSSNYGGEHGWATAEDFKGKYVQQTRVTLSESGKIYSRFLPAGSVLVTCIASIGKNAIAAIPLATNQQINSIVFHRDYDNEFFYYLLCVKKNLLLRYAGAGAMPILNKGDFSKIKLLAPVDKNEQQAISRILGDLDREQDLLKEKRTFILNQKKYLLKNLIAGIIRTPEDLQPLDASRLERSAL